MQLKQPKKGGYARQPFVISEVFVLIKELQPFREMNERSPTAE